MIGIIEKLWSFVSYWYFRYSLVTELYMVEKWERYTLHVFVFVTFSLLFYFNYKVLVPTTSQMLL